MKIKDTLKIKKEIVRRCVICGKSIEVVVYTNGKYKGGNYFGKIPGDEYWECDMCYRG